MTSKLYSEYLRESNGDSEICYSIFVKLNRPLRKSFEMNSLGKNLFLPKDEEEYYNKADGREISFSSYGQGEVESPELFQSEKVHFSINDNGSHDRYYLNKLQSIGLGQYKDSSFHFRIFMEFEVANPIIRDMEKYFEKNYDKNIYNTRFDIKNIRYIENRKETTFLVDRFRIEYY